MFVGRSGQDKPYGLEMPDKRRLAYGGAHMAA